MKLRPWTVVRATVVAGLAVMWFYAFVLAPRESFNNIKDPAWSARSEAVCRAAREERTSLADLGRIDPADPVALRKKADLIDRATDTLVRVLDAISADTPATDKGRALAPLWIADYRTYVGDRREYARTIRSGTLSEFAETQVEGVPISERLAKFARENDMKSCQPPRDLQA